MNLTERQWPTVILTPINVANHQITVSSTKNLHPKQIITLRKLDKVQDFEVRRIISETILQVGPKDSPFTQLANPTEYDGGTLECYQQERNKMGMEPVIRAVYAEEPTLALRNVLVDYWGNYIDDNNPLPVKVNANLEIGELAVQLTDKESSVGAADYDIARLGDGVNQLKFNADGSVNMIQLNKLITKKHDQISILAKNDDGNPITVAYKLLGSTVQTLNITYDSDGDVADVMVV